MMIFGYDEKTVDELLLKHEVEECEAMAETMGLSEEQTKVFVKNSIINYIRHECESLLMDKGETEKEIQKALNFLRIE